MSEKIKVIKEFKRGNQIVKSHTRKYPYKTFAQGYKEACEIILRRFTNIAIDEKEYYWRWQFMGCFLNELLEQKHKFKSKKEKKE